MLEKQFLIDQLAAQLSASVRAALDASEASATEAREGATPAEKREDARAALELGSMGRAQERRAKRAIEELDALKSWRAPSTLQKAMLGAIVEIEDPDAGEGRTFFLAPVGAGVTLTGPGGDGFLSVVTPASPIGRAVIGHGVGDTVDVTVEGEPREWTITWVG
ncbi:MAG TPA: GreA/GreB family elongation factor [Kofleriaceae bacterium]|nr:GreA/GreB family elongation factor [Kofleriaceae bacterium]